MSDVGGGLQGRANKGDGSEGVQDAAIASILAIHTSIGCRYSALCNAGRRRYASRPHGLCIRRPGLATSGEARLSLSDAGTLD